MSDFVRIASIHDIPAEGVRAFEINGRQVAVCLIGGTYYAIDNICSHEYAELSEGYLDADDCTIECPLHGSRFDLRSGRPLALPAFQPVSVFDVRVDGEDVLVRLES
ncbi:MAG TPA: non-heme iron oxygenase ferredoxin subunit [Roseiflexaceae bacterium]|nr:non-heme iron oxygenase ferredoxin subunit [Roseiflexaceae bacterium]HMP41985.1 non-heme iron oxygenase ferredoxin subunit [Roseiflexaceae bacterium]